MTSEPNQPAPNPIIGFVAGTPILTPTGSTPIGQLRPGDLIQGQPEDDHEDRTDWWHFN
jgi:hypothetical protein